MLRSLAIQQEPTSICEWEKEVASLVGITGRFPVFHRRIDHRRSGAEEGSCYYAGAAVVHENCPRKLWSNQYAPASGDSLL
jgi:hypothetical protein